MVKIKAPEADVGVIVARFQTDILTDGQKDLVNFVLDNHRKVIIFLGLSPLLTTSRDPLDFQARRQLIRESYPEKDYPNLEILYIPDCVSDKVWSNNLDQQIGRIANMQSVVLYGSRDSFIPHYKGKYKTQELQASLNISGTEIRDRIKATTRPTADFRAGIIWSTLNSFPTVYHTVDAAILNEDETELLMARKPHETKWRFCGGFTDPSSPDSETDMRREILEELTIEVGDLHYICSAKIDDWRYRNSRDCVRTTFFKTKYAFGSPQPNDDIEECRWFKIDGFYIDNLVGSHKILFRKLMENMNLKIKDNGFVEAKK